MPKLYMPRTQVHEWSEEIGNNPDNHAASFTRLLRDQRRLSKFFEENAESVGEVNAQIAMYLLGVIVRLFDLTHGRMRRATWAQIREVEARIQEVIPTLLPADADFPERVRAVEWRAQPHILDEALLALFERQKERKDEGETDMAPKQAMLVFLLLWAAVEVLDQNWTPPRGFEGESEYTFTPVELDDDDTQDASA